MSPELVGGLSLVLLIVLLIWGLPVAFSMAITGAVGYWLIGGAQTLLGMIGIIPYSTLTHYTFTVVPLFILMGNVAFEAQFGTDMYEVGRKWVGHLPGGLAQATVVANAIFGAACGSSIAAAATFGRIAIPEMQKHNYDMKLALGSVAAAGPLAVMIPPSILMVLYGMATETSIGKLLIAGFIPGILIAVLLMASIWIRCWRTPSLGAAIAPSSWKERLYSLRMIWGIGIIIAVVLGGMYAGVFTPTEAGAIGAFAAVALTLATHKINLRSLWHSLLDSAETTGMIFLIVVGAFIFNSMFAITRIPNAAAQFISQLPLSPFMVLVVVMVLYLILGCFMDTAAMLFLTMPVIFPISKALGWDPIWFGILIVCNFEIGMMTPPFGLTLFATKASQPGIGMEDVIRGTIPFLIPYLIALALLMVFPQIALVVPNMMK